MSIPLIGWYPLIQLGSCGTCWFFKLSAWTTGFILAVSCCYCLKIFSDLQTTEFFFCSIINLFYASEEADLFGMVSRFPLAVCLRADDKSSLTLDVEELGLRPAVEAFAKNVEAHGAADERDGPEILVVGMIEVELERLSISFGFTCPS